MEKMAQHNFSNVTLSLTLPMSCHICLGKVRKPVICVNHHVFCSSCIEMWLKTANRCPACRAPITEESPCREIIGGTNESEPSESSTVKRRLRKTRGELILKEYEDEIEGLLKENEDLKTTNQRLESQLKTALEPCTISVSSEDKKRKWEDWTNKLRAAAASHREMKQEITRLKEANKTFRSQNIDLVQESMRLKAEVASRSPQKFGRYTVAALEAKVQQYERDMDHLRRALERSDQYIDDLHAHGTDGGNKRRPSDLGEASRLDPASQSESGDEGVAATGAACTEKCSIATMRRSLSNMETASICTRLRGESPTLPCNGGNFLLDTSLGLAVPDQRPFVEALGSRGDKEDTTSPTSDSFLSFTPSFAFRSLSLKSPAGLCSDKKLGSKPVTYLRRLSFDGCAGPSDTGGDKPLCLDRLPEAGSSGFKPVCWSAWKTAESPPLVGASPKESQQPTTAVHGERNAPAGVSRLQGGADDANMSSEASMDAAYQDKISELDSMMLEGESSSSQGSQLSLASLRSADSADFDTTLVPELDDDVSVKADRGSTGVDSSEVVERHSSLSEQAGEEGCIDVGSIVKVTSSMLEGDGGAPGPGLLGGGGSGGPSQTDEFSFDLLFEPPPENREGPSGSHAPAGHLSSSGCPLKPGDTARDKHTMTPGKRKSHSPFNMTSTSKLSKYT